MEYQAVSRLRPLTIMCCRKIPSKLKPSRTRRAPRRLVERVAFPLVASIPKILEGVPRHQEHRLGGAGGPLQRRVRGYCRLR